MPAPVSACVICSDDPHLAACRASIEPWVAEFIVVDPRTVPDATDSQGRMLDFSVARNASFERATQPWVLWLDSDDVIAGADKLEELCKAPPGTCYILPYEYAYDELGRCVTRQYRERLVHGKERMHWLYPVHEVYAAKGPDVRFQQSDLVIWKHQRQYHPKPVEPQRNLRILEAWMRGHADDVRNMFYYGLELSNAGRIDEAIAMLEKYCSKGGWDDELAMAWYQLGRIHENRGDLDAALSAGYAALQTHDWFESYYAISRVFYRKKEWQRCVHYGNQALNTPPTRTFLFLNAADRDDIHTILTYAKNQLGDVEGAYEHCKKGLEANPKEPHLTHNRPLIEAALGKQAVGQGDPGHNGSGNAAEQNRREVAVEDSQGRRKLDIVFATLPWREKWDPETIAKEGNGGSEIMLAHMARELALLGHRVRVYAHPTAEKDYDGVAYRSVQGFKDLSCDVLVVSRYARLLDPELHVQAKVRLLWCHDVVPHEPTPALLAQADRILALSEWHRHNLIAHGCPADKTIVTRNGVDLGLYSQSPGRDPHRCICTSSPDRAWPILLRLWPQIVAEVPDAKLDLYYGLEGCRVTGQPVDQWLELIAAMPSITHHGRVSPQELADAWMRSSVWTYPTWWWETSCISAMEAKAAGCHIITTDRAALKETARGGVLLPDGGVAQDGSRYSEAYCAKFVAETVRALKSGPHGPWPDVARYGLVELAKEWEAMMLGLVGKGSSEVILEPYEPTTPYRKRAVVDRPAGQEGSDPSRQPTPPGATVAQVKLNNEARDPRRGREPQPLRRGFAMKIGLIASHAFPINLHTPGIPRSGDVVILDLAHGLKALGHEVTVFAPTGTDWEPLVEVSCTRGGYPPSTQECEIRTRSSAYSGSMLLHQDIVHDFSATKQASADLPLVVHTLMGGPWRAEMAMGKPRNLCVWSKAHRDRVLRGATDYEGTPTPDLGGPPGQPVKDAHVVWGGVDTDFYCPGDEPKEDWCLWLNRWHPAKGCRQAIEWADRNRVPLVIAGEHPADLLWDSEREYALEMQRLVIGQHPAGARVRLQWLPGAPKHHEAKRHLYRKAKALLYPVQFQEPFGLSMVEAMACGTPVEPIGSYRMGSLPEILKDPFDTHSLREHAVACFSREAFAKRYLAEYERVLAGESW